MQNFNVYRQNDANDSFHTPTYLAVLLHHVAAQREPALLATGETFQKGRPNEHVAAAREPQLPQLRRDTFVDFRRNARGASEKHRGVRQIFSSCQGWPQRVGLE